MNDNNGILSQCKLWARAVILAKQMILVRSVASLFSQQKKLRSLDNLEASVMSILGRADRQSRCAEQVNRCHLDFCHTVLPALLTLTIVYLHTILRINTFNLSYIFCSSLVIHGK